MRFLIILVLSFSLSACGIFGIFGGDDKDSDDPIPLGPNNTPRTKDQLKRLPDGLIGDQENARHTNEDLKGDDSGNQSQS